jgi:hypothetical protein
MKAGPEIHQIKAARLQIHANFHENVYKWIISSRTKKEAIYTLSMTL